MLDGRVLGASQVEYRPFGKPPLQREMPRFKFHAKKLTSRTEVPKRNSQ